MFDVTEEDDPALELALLVELGAHQLDRLRSEVRALRLVGLADERVREHVWERAADIQRRSIVRGRWR